jgi:hypothetical protein
MSAILTTLAVLAPLGAGAGAEIALPMAEGSNGVAIATGSVFLLLALARLWPIFEESDARDGPEYGVARDFR